MIASSRMRRDEDGGAPSGRRRPTSSEHGIRGENPRPFHDISSLHTTTITMDLSPGSRILITGVTGHVASHLALQVLSSPEGFRVIGTTRSTAKGDFLQGVFRAKGFGPDRFEYVVVDNMEDEATWDNIFEGKGVQEVAHVASPFAFGKDLDPEVLRRPAVNGTLAVLKSSAKYGVKRVVMTGSLPGRGLAQRQANRRHAGRV